MKMRRVMFPAAVTAVCLLCGCTKNGSQVESENVVERIADIATT